VRVGVGCSGVWVLVVRLEGWKGTFLDEGFWRGGMEVEAGKAGLEVRWGRGGCVGAVGRIVTFLRRPSGRLCCPEGHQDWAA
jgi:hypothetical protein